MKSRNYLLVGLTLVFLFSSNSCKPKESAYKTAYEAARGRDIQDNSGEITSITKPVYDDYTQTDVVQKEKVTVIDGAAIQQFSVVIGSFQNKTNAISLKERMENQGFKSLVAQNERGMYRVIVASFNDKYSAVTEKEHVKNKYYPEFQDAWILDNK